MTNLGADGSAAFHAGPLEALVEGVDVALLRDAGREVLRRIGVRVRSPDWGTVPPRIEHVDLRRGAASVQIEVGARHEDDRLAFAWTGKVLLTERSLSYEMDGIAERDFPYARIGIVVHHPPAVTAGCRYRAQREGGEGTAGVLPKFVGPQLIRDGQVQPLFPGFDELEIDVAPGLQLRFTFEGAIFEMEDQRNWTDASFKTYSTPVALPIPHHATRGSRIRQRVTVHVVTSRHRRRPQASPPWVITVAQTDSDRFMLPAGSGLGRVASDQAAVGAALKRLRPCHLHVELSPGEDEFRRLAQAQELAGAIDSQLELELRVPAAEAEANRWLEEISARMPDAASVPARIVLARTGEPVTTLRTAQLARDHMPAAVLLGGSPTNFAELNREPPPAKAPLDGLYHAVNPQVHDSDDRSLMQSPWGQRDAVLTALRLPGRRPVHVTPITLRPRHAARPDPRQESPLSAAWLVASAAAVVSAGAASATWFELWGPLGLCESGRMSPAFAVLEELCSWNGLPVATVGSNDEETVAAIGVLRESETRLLVANLSDIATSTKLEGPPGDVVGRQLAGANGPGPGLGRLCVSDGVLALGPYEVVLVRWGHATPVIQSPRPSQPGEASTSS